LFLRVTPYIGHKIPLLFLFFPPKEGLILALVEFGVVISYGDTKCTIIN
jgi:hypothetical protein